MAGRWTGTFSTLLRRVHGPTLVVALALYACGILAIHQAEVFEDVPFRASFAFKQLVFGGAALAALVASLAIPPSWFERSALGLWGIGVFLLLICAFIGVVKNNARRWIDLGVLLLQPSEPMKIGLVLAASKILGDFRNARGPALVGLGVLTGVPFLLIVRQPDLGTSLMLVPIAGTLAFLSGLRWRVIAGVVVVAGLAAPIAFETVLEPYQKKRVFAFLDQESGRDAENYQLTRALEAIGSGGMAGVRDRDQLYSLLSRVPERHTDFVFAVIGARYGLMGAGAVVILEAALVLALLRLAAKSRDPFGRLVPSGVAAMLGTQAFWNIAMNLGLAPITGLPLPLVSYGGSSLVTTTFALGISMNAARRPQPHGYGRSGA